MKKYQLTEETKVFNGITLYRIKALQDFADVKAGDKGGWIQKESNLPQDGDCWVYEEAMVYNSIINGDVTISGTSVIKNSSIYDSAKIVNSTIEGAIIKGRCFIGGCNIEGIVRIIESKILDTNIYSYETAVIINDSDIQCSDFYKDTNELTSISSTFTYNANLFQPKSLINSFITDSQIEYSYVCESHISDESVIKNCSLDDCTLEYVKAVKQDLCGETLQHVNAEEANEIRYAM